MSHFTRNLRFAAAVFLCLTSPGFAADEVQPAPAVSAATLPDPSPDAMAQARRVLDTTGFHDLLNVIVTQEMSKMEISITPSRPDLKEPIQTQMIALEGEFLKTTEDVLRIASKEIALNMSADDLKATANFLDSPAGKKYVAVQIAFVEHFRPGISEYRARLSNYINERIRGELKKKGYEF